MMENSFIGLASPDIRESDIQRVSDVLRSGMLVQGTQVRQLEEGFASICGTKDAAAVANGTATMHLILRALGIGPGDEVIVPAFSYVATANVVELVGARPVFVDIDTATFNIDANKVEKAITDRTRAVIPVHEFGLACDISAISSIALRHNLFVIEDAACALGATENGKPVGSFGIAGSFSLHPRKSITSGEGGVVTSNDKLLIHKIRQLRNHGIEMVDGTMIFEEAGFNYRMTDFQAALAGGQLERLNEILEKKRRLATIYLEEIKNPCVSLPVIPANREHTWQTFHLLLADDIRQADVIARLKKAGIGANYGAQCIPAQKYYLKKYGGDPENTYPYAWRAYKQGLAIPLYERLSESQIIFIAREINKI